MASTPNTIGLFDSVIRRALKTPRSTCPADSKIYAFNRLIFFNFFRRLNKNAE